MKAALAILAAAAIAGTAQAQQHTMKLSTSTSGDALVEWLNTLKKGVEASSGGKIKVEVYPASQLGGAQRQVEGLRLGTIEAAIGPSELFFGADPRFQVLALAGLFKNNEHARRALDVPAFRKAIVDFTDPRGLVTIGLNVYDQQVFTFKAPVTKLADFPGKRVRVLACETRPAHILRVIGQTVEQRVAEAEESPLGMGACGKYPQRPERADRGQQHDGLAAHRIRDRVRDLGVEVRLHPDHLDALRFHLADQS